MNRQDILYVGSVMYWTIRTYDPDSPGVLKDADSTPTVAIRKNGSAVGDSVTVTKRSATTGIYDCEYNPAGEAEGDQFTVEESATMTGTTTASATYSQSWNFVVAAVERGTDNAALESTLDEIKGSGFDVATDALDAIRAAVDAVEGGGSVSVNVLPAVGIVADRSPGATIQPVVGETISQSITLYATDGTTPINLSGKTLAIVFETLRGVDVATVDNDQIAVSGTSNNVVTFAYPGAVTASERTLRFAIRDAAAPLTLYLQGLCIVTRAPQVD
jgi:hypothetical protein